MNEYITLLTRSKFISSTVQDVQQGDLQEEEQQQLVDGGPPAINEIPETPQGTETEDCNDSMEDTSQETLSSASDPVDTHKPIQATAVQGVQVPNGCSESSEDYNNSVENTVEETISSTASRYGGQSRSLQIIAPQEIELFNRRRQEHNRVKNVIREISVLRVAESSLHKEVADTGKPPTIPRTLKANETATVVPRCTSQMEIALRSLNEEDSEPLRAHWWQGLGEFLRVALPSTCLCIFEWASFEVGIFYSYLSL